MIYDYKNIRLDRGLDFLYYFTGKHNKSKTRSEHRLESLVRVTDDKTSVSSVSSDCQKWLSIESPSIRLKLN